MSLRTKIFTAHENIALDEPADRIELVREGFSFLAMLLTPLWLLANRLWLEFLVYLLLVAGLFEAADQLGAGAALFLLLVAFMQVLAGSVAFDIKRWALARRGYRLRTVVAAETPLNAQRRYFDHLA